MSKLRSVVVLAALIFLGAYTTLSGLQTWSDPWLILFLNLVSFWFVNFAVLIGLAIQLFYEKTKNPRAR